MSDRGRGEFWAFMAGILAGGVAALLYAPARGEETRRKIRETAEDAYHKGEEYYEKGMTEAERIYHEGREKVEEVVDTISGKGHPAKETEAPEPPPAKAGKK